MRKIAWLLLLVLGVSVSALAQSVPNGGSITSGEIWSTSQWTTAFQSKADTNSAVLTGTPTAPTPSTSDNSTKLATTAFVDAYVATNPGGYATTAALASYAPLASPALTGTPTAPTASCGSGTQIATLSYVASCVPGGGSSTPTGVTPDKPGLSATLFASPGYTCSTNIYVSTTGSDSTGNGSIGNPYATMFGANNNYGSFAPGLCVNVEPGTYSLTGGATTLSHAGNADTPTGYVVWRCTTLGGCIERQTTSTGGGLFTITASYVWLDGFELDGNLTGCSGLPCVQDDGVNMLAANTAVYNRITNNYVHGMGGNGIEVSSGGDCGWVVHNVTSYNASTNGAADSGVSIYQPHPVSGTTACGATDSFHFHLQWNVAYNNVEGSTISTGGHTDGDGFIMDTFSTYSYTYPTLVANNVAYANGGFCVGEDSSPNVVFANNTCYANYTDSLNTGTYRAELWNNNGSSNTFINNVVYAVAGSGTLANNVTALSFNTTTNNTWSKNILYGPAPVDHTTGGTSPISCSFNLCGVDPLYSNRSSNNLALASGSPAAAPAFVSEVYLPWTDYVAGACYANLTTCP